VGLDVQNVGKLLGLTPQQFDILQCVYRLQVDDLQASPKAIQADYRKHTDKHLMKPNLFNILRILKGKAFIMQESYGTYNINFEAVNEAIKAEEERLRSELDGFQSIASRTEEYFRKVVTQHERPYVTYLEPHEFSKNISKSLQTATTYYSTTSFPNITFNPEVASAIKRPEYVNVLWVRGIIKQELTVKYLTDLNIEYLFNYVSKAYPDKDTSYRVCLDALNQLKAHIDGHENLEVYYQSTPLYLDIHMPENQTPKEFYSHLRGLRSEIRGVVYVKSRDAAHATKKLFQEMLDRCDRLQGAKGKRVISAKRKELKQMSNI
jgi:hypothetical protein